MVILKYFFRKSSTEFSGPSGHPTSLCRQRGWDLFSLTFWRELISKGPVDDLKPSYNFSHKILGAGIIVKRHTWSIKLSGQLNICKLKICPKWTRKSAPSGRLTVLDTSLLLKTTFKYTERLLTSSLLETSALKRKTIHSCGYCYFTKDHHTFVKWILNLTGDTWQLCWSRQPPFDPDEDRSWVAYYNQM